MWRGFTAAAVTATMTVAVVAVISCVLLLLSPTALTSWLPAEDSIMSYSSTSYSDVSDVAKLICRETWDQRKYRLVRLLDYASPSRREANAEGLLASLELPILFIPGHRGAVTQARGIAHAIAKYTTNHRSRVGGMSAVLFAADFHGESSIHNGRTVFRQACFVYSAAAALSSAFNNSPNDGARRPRRVRKGGVWVIAHSMGGLVGRLAAVQHSQHVGMAADDFPKRRCCCHVEGGGTGGDAHLQTNPIAGLLLLNTPYFMAPIIFDGFARTLWTELRSRSRNALLGGVEVFAFSGGILDEVIDHRTALGALENGGVSVSPSGDVLPSTSRFFSTSNLRRVGVPLSHQSILWAAQFTEGVLAPLAVLKSTSSFTTMANEAEAEELLSPVHRLGWKGFADGDEDEGVDNSPLGGDVDGLGSTDDCADVPWVDLISSNVSSSRSLMCGNNEECRRQGVVLALVALLINVDGSDADANNVAEIDFRIRFSPRSSSSDRETTLPRLVWTHLGTPDGLVEVETRHRSNGRHGTCPKPQIDGSGERGLMAVWFVHSSRLCEQKMEETEGHKPVLALCRNNHSRVTASAVGGGLIDIGCDDHRRSQMRGKMSLVSKATKGDNVESVAFSLTALCNVSHLRPLSVRLGAVEAGAKLLGAGIAVSLLRGEPAQVFLQRCTSAQDCGRDYFVLAPYHRPSSYLLITVDSDSPKFGEEAHVSCPLAMGRDDSRIHTLLSLARQSYIQLRYWSVAVHARVACSVLVLPFVSMWMLLGSSGAGSGSAMAHVTTSRRLLLFSKALILFHLSRCVAMTGFLAACGQSCVDGTPPNALLLCSCCTSWSEHMALWGGGDSHGSHDEAAAAFDQAALINALARRLVDGSDVVVALITGGMGMLTAILLHVVKATCRHVAACSTSVVFHNASFAKYLHHVPFLVSGLLALLALLQWDDGDEIVPVAALVAALGFLLAAQLVLDSMIFHKKASSTFMSTFSNREINALDGTLAATCIVLCIFLAKFVLSLLRDDDAGRVIPTVTAVIDRETSYAALGKISSLTDAAARSADFFTALMSIDVLALLTFLTLVRLLARTGLLRILIRGGLWMVFMMVLGWQFANANDVPAGMLVVVVMAQLVVT